MMKYILKLSLLVFAIVAKSQTDSLYFTTQDTLNLDQVKIKASHLASPNTPFTYSEVKADELDSKNFGQEGSFILSNNIPSFAANSDAGSYLGYSYFRLRGIDQTRINMTLNGVPLNEPEDQGVYFSNYPDFLNSVSSFQVQRGVGTSKNGTASYAGSIDFTSPNLRDSTSKEVGVGYGSFNTYRVYGEYNMGLKKNFGLYVRASHLHSDGYKDRSANTSSSIFYSAGHFKKNHALKLTGFAGNQANQMAWIGVSDSLIDVNPKTNGNTEEDDKFFQTLQMLQYSYYLNSRSVLSASMYYNYLKGDYDFDFNNFLGFLSTDELYNYAFESHFNGGFVNYNYYGKNLNATAGVHGNLYQRKHTGTEATLGELYVNTGFKNEASSFLKLNYKLNGFRLFSDLQYRFVNFDYDGSIEMEKLNWSFFNPKGGISYQASKKSLLYYSIGKAYREPTRNDLFGGWDDLPADSLGNSILYVLEPEWVIDHELGFRYHSSKLHVGANLFYMLFENEIVLNGQIGPNGLTLHSDVDESWRAGLELELDYQISSSWLIKNNSSFSRNQIKESGETINPILSPNVIVNQEVEYNYRKLRLGLLLKYQDRSFIDFANENTISSFLQLNSRIGYSIKNFDGSILLNNVLNQQYYSNGYIGGDGTPLFFVQAPFNIFGNLRWKF